MPTAPDALGLPGRHHVNPSDRPTAPPSNDDTLGRGMEFAIITLVFLVIGLGVDAIAGTRPIVTIAAVTFAFVAQFVRMHYTYSERMRVLEAERSAQASAVPRATIAPASPAAPDTLPTGITLEGRAEVRGTGA